jgi:hypothetical protein
MDNADRNGADGAVQEPRRATGLYGPTASSIGRVADLLSEALARDDLNDVREPIAALTRGLHTYAANLGAI